jgi:hypothetical protein
MKVAISPGSDRTFFNALWKARLPEPTSSPGRTLDREIGNLWLTLLVLGIDHDLVGSPLWVQRIVQAAPRSCRPRSRPRRDQ